MAPFFSPQPADSTRTAEALGKRGWTEGDNKTEVARLCAVLVRLCCVFRGHCSQAGQLKRVRVEKGGGGREDEGKDDDKREG